jgi:Heterokaryon incompatibility protein (HET)
MSRDQELQSSTIEMSRTLSDSLNDSFAQLSTSELSIYQPLVGSQIRLSRLRPGSWDDPMVCDLIHVRLDDRPKYLALSYTWGDATVTRLITLNGHLRQITTSLFQCLRRLRCITLEAHEHPSFITEKLENFYIWADAICINQDDEMEKCHQISRKGDIYTYADRVCAWLGENEPEEYDTIYRIMGMAHRIDLSTQVWKPYFRELFDSAGTVYTSIAYGIIRLSSRPWWSRVWVIQEVSLGSRTPILPAGGAWPYFTSYIKLVEAVASHQMRTLIDARQFTLLLHPLTLYKTREGCQEEIFCETRRAALDCDFARLGATLEKMLTRASSVTLQAALPHDYIYGLLGLIGPVTLPSPLAPDYRKDFAQVYRDYTSFIIGNTGSLSILCRIRHTMEGGPSWVRDFRLKGPYNSITEEPRQPSLPIHFSEDRNRMTVYGVRFGTCKHVFVPSTEWSARDQIGLFNQFLFQAAASEHVSKDDLMESWLPRRGADGIVLEDFKQAYNSILGGFASISNQNERQAQDVIHSLLSIFSTFVTDRGVLAKLSYPDLAPQPGDAMCAVQGASNSLLLRPSLKDGEYEYLGCSYHKDFKYNEASSNQVLQPFVIV